MKTRRLPFIIVGVFLLYAVAEAVGPRQDAGGFDLAAFGRLPVAINGRVQPMDSVARVGLLQIRGSVTVPLDNAGLITRIVSTVRASTASLGATEWLLELMTKPDAADARRVFPIRESTLRTTLGLSANGRAAASYYTFKDLEPKLPEIANQTTRIGKIAPANRAAWERELLKLRGGLIIYERLKNGLQPNSLVQQAAKGKPIAYDFGGMLMGYITDLRGGVEAAVAREHGKDSTLDKATEDRMRTFARPFASVVRAALLTPIPPDNPAQGRDHWRNLGAVLIDSARNGQLPLSVGYYAAMSSAFAQNKPAVFDAEVAKYQQWLAAKGFSPEVSRAGFEFFNSHFQPFVRAAAVYLVAIALLCLSRFRRSAMLYRSAALLVVLALLLHASGVLFDMMLEGRLPTANTYSVIIVAGLGLALLGGIRERLMPNGVGLMAAALVGLAALVAAHSVAPGGAVGLLGNAVDFSFIVTVVAAGLVLRIASDTTVATGRPRVAVAAA